MSWFFYLESELSSQIYFRYIEKLCFAAFI